MDKFKYYEVEIQFLSPAGAVVPVTARSEEEAKEIVTDLFKDHQNLQITKVVDITKNPDQPEKPLLN